MLNSVGSPVLWVGFTVFVVALLVFDLAVLRRKSHVVGAREAFFWTMFWVGLAFLFNVGIWRFFGPEKGLEFLTGYLIEETLSVDNIFVFLVIFSYFGVPAEQKYKVLFWGILGAIVFRFLFILAGTALISTFHWIIYVFGAFLIFTGVKLFRTGDDEADFEKNKALRFLRTHLRLTSEYHGQKFRVKIDGKWFFTPLALVLALIELTDIVFAFDSIPAIFAVTRDPFIVYTSNIFAILGLRSIFFLLAGSMGRFRYLHYGLGLVLAFVGLKMVLSDIYHIPIVLSLGIVAGLIGGSILVSLIKKPPSND